MRATKRQRRRQREQLSRFAERRRRRLLARRGAVAFASARAAVRAAAGRVLADVLLHRGARTLGTFGIYTLTARPRWGAIGA